MIARRLPLRPRVHHPILTLQRGTQAVAAGQLDDARRHPDRRRVRRARRRVQHDGRPAGRAAGERQAAGAPGDVRPRRRRPRPRPVASDPEHRQQHAPAAARRPRRRSRATCSAAPSSASCGRSSASWTTCATSSSRSRSSASRWTSTARSPRSSSRCAPKASATASPSKRSYAPGPLVIEGDRFALGRVYRNLITNAIQATRAGRPRHDRDRRASAIASRSRVDRHRLGHPGRSARGDLRRLRHDQAPRPRPGPRDLEAHRRTARRHDRRRERSRPRHGVHAAVSRRATIASAQAAAS